MIRPARPDDEPAIAAFLDARAESSMFMAANLARDMRGFWVAGDPLENVVQLSPRDFFLTQAETLPAEDWARLRRRLRGRPCHGVNGRPGPVAAALEGLHLATRQATLDRIEPLFTLDLTRLIVPEGATTLRPVIEVDLPTLVPWRAAYLSETMHAPAGPATDAAAEEQMRGLLAAGWMRVLEEGGQPVAICAFNAALPDRVQVGGVYTPPGLRGRGHARRAVALHLAEARAAGTTRAVLFAASPAAASAYRAVGFTRDGGYRLVLYSPPVAIGR